MRFHPTADQILRRCRFTPYRKGMGPTFALTTWTTYRYDTRGRTLIGYRLTMTESGKRSIVFEGEDFSMGMGAIDSDSSITGIMGFLTLGRYDTDAEYFASYTPEQIAYRDQHAEYLGSCVTDRFGHD
jgi:hypothetical protein